MAYDIARELELPEGKVLLWKIKSKKEIIDRLKEIMDKWEKQGYKKPNDVPESPEKKEYRKLLRSLGLKVEF